MNEQNVLPEDFDGVFRFTNFTEEDFTGTWNKVDYTFPALKTSPMIISGATPEDVQHIRKKFAKELAIREWYKTPKFVGMNANTPGGTPALYTDSDIAPFVQRCLEPLPIASAKAVALPKVDENQFLHKDEEGNNVTQILDKKKSLLAEGSGVVA